MYRNRPRNWFLRINFVGIAIVALIAWFQLDVEWSDLFSSRRLENLKRFGTEIYPFSLRGKPFRVDELWAWAKQILVERGFVATLTTFAISVVAIVIAGTTAAAFVFPAARNIATSTPFIPNGESVSVIRIWKWKIVVFVVRSWFVLARAIPEYIWAFLLIGIIGPGAWPAILALAIHNFGILGRLGAEVVEITDPSVAAGLRICVFDNFRS